MSAERREESAKSVIIAGALLAQVLLSVLLPHAAQAGVIQRSEKDVNELTNATANTTIPIIIATTPTTEALVPDTVVASDETPKIAPPDGAPKNTSDSLTPRTKLLPQATVVSLRQAPGGSVGGGSLVLNRVEMEPLSNENGQLHSKDGSQGGPDSSGDTTRVLNHDSGSDNSTIVKLQAVGLSKHVNDGLEALTVEHLALDKGVEKGERTKEETTTETALSEVEAMAVATKVPPSPTTLSSVQVGHRRSTLRSEESPGEYYEKELKVTTIEPLAIELLAATQPSTTSTILATMSAHENIIEDQASQETRVSGAEKRGKFISDNSTNAQQLNLPQAAEVWTLIGMKPAPTPKSRPQQEAGIAGSTEATSTNSEKNLLDWTQIMMNAQLETQRKKQVASEVFENRTETMTNATLDTTDGFVDAMITPETIKDHRLEALKNAENSIERESGLNTVAGKEELQLKPVETKTFAPATTMARPSEETETKEETGAKGPAILSSNGSDNNSNNDIGTAERASEAPETESTVASSSDHVREDSAATMTNAAATTMTAITTTTETALPENHSATGSTTTAPLPTADAAANDSTTPPERLLSVASSETTTFSTRLITNTTTSARDDDVKGESVKGDNGEGENKIRPDAATTVFATRTATKIPTPPPTTVLAITEVGLIGNEVDLDLLVETKATKAQDVNTTERRDEEGTVAKEEEASEGFITRAKNKTLTPTTARPPTSLVSDLLISTTTTTTETATTSVVPIITKTISTTAAAATSTELTPVQPSIAPTTGSVPVEVVQTTTKATTTTLTAASTVGDTDGGGAKRVDTESSIETNVIDPLERRATTASTIATFTATAPITTKPKQEEAENVKETSNALGVDDDEEVARHANTLLPQTTTLHTTTTTMGTLTPTTRTTIPTRTTTTTVEPPLINLLDDSTTTIATTVTPNSLGANIEELNKVIALTVSPLETTSSFSFASPHSTTSIVPPTNSTAIAPLTTTTTLLPPSIMHASIGRGGGAMPVMPTTSSDNTLSMTSGNLRPNSVDPPETDVNVIIAITVSVIGVIALILLVAFLYLIRKRQKQMSYGQRCRPVSLDAYSLDNVSVLGSVRRKGAARASKRSYGNIAFDDPSLRHNVLTATELAKFVERRSSIFEEFRDVPQIIARANEVPPGCEDKNRYANVIPLPETRVILQQQSDDEKSEYINANYVRGPKDAPNYYIACQAPLEATVTDFWRMIWEQQSRVIIQSTDLIENGIEKCAEYLPPSVTLDNHTTYGDFQVTLKHREVKDKYAISTLVLKNTLADASRELTHYWYKWPESGVPAEEAPIIAMLLEARSSLKSYSIEEANELKEISSTLTLRADGGIAESPTSSMHKQNANGSAVEINGIKALDKLRTAAKSQGPLTIHCSPGTGRTGTVIACDMAIRSLETPKRSVDIPQIVYYVRRGRASAVQTKEQYEFIYKVALMYATKITNPSQEN